jgi:DNA polymerase-3 subunit alpha
MEACLPIFPRHLANTVEIAKRCNLTLVLGKPQLPDFPTPVNAPALCGAAGVRDGHHPQDGLPRLLPDRGRLHPLGQEQRLPGGAGAGFGRRARWWPMRSRSPTWTRCSTTCCSSAFLNPERVSMPDFDIDFCQANRDRVIDYVKDKYGKDAVSQIATFGTMAAKAAIRDVGRVLDMSYTFCDGISKLVPAKPGRPTPWPTRPRPRRTATRQLRAGAGAPAGERVARKRTCAPSSRWRKSSKA